VGRKTARDGGQVALAIAGQVEATERALAARPSAASKAMGKRLRTAREAFVQVVQFVAGQTRAGPAAANAVFAGSVPYLMLAGNVMVGWQMARALIVAEDAGPGNAFMAAKATTARFYSEHILSKVPGIRDSILDGHTAVTEMALEAF
jgi:3-(methylthio)propanoyl-CoA dehydrogenase